MKGKTLCFLLVLGLTGVASAIVWDGGGGDGDWHTEENWAGDAVPGAGATCEIGWGGAPSINGDVDVGMIAVAMWNQGDGSITINSGDVIANGGVGMGNKNGGTGQITMNGGSLTVNSWGLYVGYQDGVGILTVNDGVINCNTPLRVAYGTWDATEVTKGTVYLHGGTIYANSGLSMNDLGAGTGTQESLIEFDGSGTLIIAEDQEAFIDGEIQAGRITAVGGQTVVATYDPDTQMTTVQIPEPATLLLAACGLGLIARKRR